MLKKAQVSVYNANGRAKVLRIFNNSLPYVNNGGKTGLLHGRVCHIQQDKMIASDSSCESKGMMTTTWKETSESVLNIPRAIPKYIYRFVLKKSRK